MKRIIKVSLLKRKAKLEKLIKENYFDKIEEKNNYNILFNLQNIKIENKLIDLFLDKKENRTKISTRESLLVIKYITLNKEKRTLIISIGDTRKIIDLEELEENFGIKIGINYSLKNKKKQVQIKEIISKNKATGDNFKEGKNSLTNNLLNFHFRPTTNILKSIKIKEEFEKTNTLLNLNEWISIPINEQQNKKEIFVKIEKFIVDNYNDLYKKEFQFLDYWINVGKEIEEKLTKKMFKMIEDNSKEFTGIFVWPEFEDDQHEYFTIGKSNEQLFILDNKKKIIKIAKKEKGNFRNIKIYSRSTEFKIKSFPISKCIFFEYIYKSKQYIFNDGKWFQIKKEFLEEMNKAYDKLSNSIFKEEFPTWKSNLKEKEYNQKLEKEKKWLLLDRKMISFGGMNRLEIGDLAITSKNILIAVKNIHNSENMSHLVQQVENSIKAINGGCEKIQEQFDKKSIDINIKKILDTKKYVIAIGSENKLKNNLPKIPFFAKLSLIELVERSPYAFQIQIVWINIRK